MSFYSSFHRNLDEDGKSIEREILDTLTFNNLKKAKLNLEEMENLLKSEKKVCLPR